MIKLLIAALAGAAIVFILTVLIFGLIGAYRENEKLKTELSAHEKAEACDFCGKGSKASSSCNEIYLEKIGNMKGLKVYSHYCPPFAECSHENKCSTSFFEIKYCPYCGRKL